MNDIDLPHLRAIQDAALAEYDKRLAIMSGDLQQFAIADHMMTLQRCVSRDSGGRLPTGLTP
jgi:hypothetical protein